MHQSSNRVCKIMESISSDQEKILIQNYKTNTQTCNLFFITFCIRTYVIDN